VPRRKKGDRQPGHLLDTNVLLRFLIGDDPPKAARAKALMERLEKGEEFVILPDEVITETVWTLESYYEVPRPETTQRLTALLSFPGIRVSSRSIVLNALRHYSATAADFVDCFLAARSTDQGIPVYSFDETDFKKLNVAWERP